MSICRKIPFKLRGRIRRRTKLLATKSNYGYSAQKTVLKTEIKWLKAFGLFHMRKNPEQMLKKLIDFDEHLLSLANDYSELLGKNGSHISGTG